MFKGKKKEASVQNEENSSKEQKKSKKKRKLKKPEFYTNMKPQSKVIFLLTVALLILITFLWQVIKPSGSKLTTMTNSTLEKVIEINELSAIDYTYNATVTKYDEDNDPMYYVAYEGVVTAGIDFNKININVIDNEKKVVITIPKVEIQGSRVDMGTLEYIFVKDKYETETISQEAYKLCKNDLEKRATKEDLLMDTATENVISSLEALFKPWIETIDSSYEVEIKQEGM